MLLKKDYQIIRAVHDKNTFAFYPADCFIRFKNKNYLTTTRWIYCFNILSKKITPQSESILVEKFDFLDHHYANKDKEFAFLFVKEKDSLIKYQGKSYAIDYKNGDSLFSEINNNEIIIFIHSKNTD